MSASQTDNEKTREAVLRAFQTFLRNEIKNKEKLHIEKERHVLCGTGSRNEYPPKMEVKDVRDSV